MIRRCLVLATVSAVALLVIPRSGQLAAQLPQVVGGPERPPTSAPGWRWASEQLWVNDISGDTFRPGDPLPPSPEPGEYEYDAVFDHDGGSWLALSGTPSNALERSEWKDASFWSHSPWWPDTNHATADNRRNIVNLVGLLYSRYLHPNAGVHQIDFREGQIRVGLKPDHLHLNGAHLLFWVQARQSDGRYANLVLTDHLEEHLHDGQWRTFDLTLPVDDSRWSCLASRPDLTTVYRCATAADVLSDVNRDFGFLLYPVSLSHPPQGEFLFGDIHIKYRLTRRIPTPES